MLRLEKRSSPILIAGDERTAYRDPTVLYHAGRFYLYFTLVETEADGRVFLYLAMSESEDLIHFSDPVKLTPRDAALNFSSPGNVLRCGERWVLCLQTYPRPDGEKYGTEAARIWTMTSTDLRSWSAPQLLRVKGPEVPDEHMGRMIDPYLLPDIHTPGRWWCFYKQQGMSLSWSDDLSHWTFHGRVEAGENVCVVPDRGRYRALHSPHNGISMLVSDDLVTWRPEGDLITLGQSQWPWAQGRLTAGFALDGREDPNIGRILLFFHGTGPEDESVVFDTHACLGLAWSDDWVHWSWPGRAEPDTMGKNHAKNLTLDLFTETG